MHIGLILTILLSGGTTFAAGSLQQIDDPAVDNLAHELAADIRRAFFETYKIDEACSPRLVDIMRDLEEGADVASVLVIENRCTNLVDAIIKLADNPDAAVRTMAASTLPRLDQARSRKVSERLLRDPSESVRIAALNGNCGGSHSECSAALLRETVADSSPRVRRRALMLSRQLEYRFEKEVYLKLLSDPSISVVVENLLSLPCDLAGADDCRTGLGAMARGALNEEVVQQAAIQAIGRCRIREACGTLTEVLRKEGEAASEPLKIALFQGIIDCGSCDAKGVLEEFVLLNSSPTDMSAVVASNERTALEIAVTGLGRYGRASSRQALVRAMGDPYYRVRYAAVEAVDRLEFGGELAGILSEVSKVDASELVRERARQALSRIRD